MQKYLLLTIAILYGCNKKEATRDNIIFEDSNFKTAVVRQHDTDGDNNISTTEATAITTLTISFEDIESLNDINYFENVTHLDCSGNKLTELQIPSNIKLTELFCSSNQLSELDISDSDSLKTLYCADNFLTALNTTNNINLKELSCAENKITAVDISQNKDLLYFYCNGNNLSKLNVSHNTKLIGINCYKNPNLTLLEMAHNQEIPSFTKDDQTEIVYVN